MAAVTDGKGCSEYEAHCAVQQGTRQKIRNDYYTRFPGENGESCEDIHNRTIPFFNSFILPHLAAGRNVLVSSHGFVIRTLIKYLDGMDAHEFNEQMKLEKSAPDKCLLLAPTGML